MEQIEVGEYGRTRDGYIGKVVNRPGGIDIAIDYRASHNLNDIVKHSKNIIDLIEVGDYVNGYLVSNVDKIDNMNVVEWDNGEMYSTEIPNDKFIKSIVTKEQFASTEYRLED